MILDTEQFIANEQGYWRKLSARLDAFDENLPGARDMDTLLEIHHLYRRAASALARLEAAAADPSAIQQLQQLVARAYGTVHAGRKRHPWRDLWHWVAYGFPQAFRRQFGAFAACLWITLGGMVIGSALIAINPSNREVIMPFSHLHGSPSERVANEEKNAGSDDARNSPNARFAASLMQNNISVTIRALALGITYGIGTAILLFYNGVILGGVCFDYVQDGQTIFLLGWLMPHGVIELPAIFLGGQAGFVLARALIGRGTQDGLRTRLRAVAPDLASIVMGAAILLVWAGLVESYLSQHHEPAIPYWVKIAFGTIELMALILWLGFSGRNRDRTQRTS